MSIKQAVKKLLASTGYAIVNLESYRARMESAIEGLYVRKHSFKTVIDIGASDGRWSGMCMKYFPFCQYLLVEAQSVHQEELRLFCNRHSNAQFVLAAAGDALGQIYFDASHPFIGQASHTPDVSHAIQVPMTTIDHEIQSRQFGGPYLVKLDTHGFEVPILNGAMNVLEQTKVIVMECYNHRITSECLLFFEMCEYLQKFGFRCIDLVDPQHRPSDKTFWQADLVFVRDDRPEFSRREFI